MNQAPHNPPSNNNNRPTIAPRNHALPGTSNHGIGGGGEQTMVPNHGNPHQASHHHRLVGTTTPNGGSASASRRPAPNQQHPMQNSHGMTTTNNSSSSNNNNNNNNTRLAPRGLQFSQLPASGMAPATGGARSGTWSVPNPLALGRGPGHNKASSSSSFASHQIVHRNHHAANNAHHPSNPPVAPASNTANNKTTATPPAAAVTTSSSSGTSGSKPKVVLSPEARQALATAIWSAIRSPDGSVDPKAMEEAVAAGLPRQAILSAARVAREREAAKRKHLIHQQQQQQQLRQQQQQQQQQRHHQELAQQRLQEQQQNAARDSRTLAGRQSLFAQNTIHTTRVAPPSAPLQAPSSHHPTHLSQLAKQQMALQPGRVATQVAPKPAVTATVAPRSNSNIAFATSSRTTPTTTTASAVAPKHQASSSVTQTSSTEPAVNPKVEERNRWKRLHSGVFVIHRSRFQALPNSITTILRTTDTSIPHLPPKPSSVRVGPTVLERAISIQEAFRKQDHVPEPALLDPEKFKRQKLEPKRVAKALDRSLKKSRTSTAEALVKVHKDLSKAIVSHQAEFFKYHRSRKTDLAKLAKAVRDRFTKQVKQEQKTADQAERARLAALRANDMAAYSKLLEDTKNERLKFLLGKTDECISQISSLLQKRNSQDADNIDGLQVGFNDAESYYTSAHFKAEEVRQPSILVGGDLKEYQLAGLQWLVSLYNNRLNGILADEMGLGKTIQAISLVAYLMEFKENLGPYLVVVPLSTLSNWVNEFAKWCPSARLVVYKGNPSQRREIFKMEVRSGHFNVLLTTYEYIIKDKGSLKKLTWQYAIVDEGHRMKNAQSKFAVTLGTQYTTKNRILLTGTPLQNNLPELWALLNFLLPTIFNSVESFDQWFNRPFAQFGGGNNTEESTDQMLNNEERMLIIHRLHELLRPFMLRRVKSEVLDQLPEKVEKVLRCELSSWQRELYKQISAKAKEDKSLMGTQTEAPTRGLNNVVMQLRKVCNHPYLFSPEGYHINDNLIRSSGKLELLDRILPKLKVAGHRVLMFTQMTAVMTILEDYFAFRGYCSLRLDGSTAAEEREKRMYKFNAPDSPYFIFLLSTRAGGLGLNLATADVVVIFDSDWNPMMDLQAQDRAHRIGQRSDVSVFRLVTYSPVEEKILSRATEKLNMSELVVEAGKFDKSSVENDNSLERKRMMEVLLTDFDSNVRQGAEIPGDDGSDDGGSDASNKEDLNELLSNNEADYQVYCSLDEEGITNSETRLFTESDNIPDWIKHPGGTNGSSRKIPFDPNASRKRKAVEYDDGLTEKQFLRMMEKQAENEEAQVRATKKKRGRAAKAKQAAVSLPDAAEPTEQMEPPGTLTEWTFRKLISTCRSVIALKEHATKRRLSEIFLEKPCANTYPDYYEVIERPIAINDILRKCRGHLYASLQEFWDDWNLLFMNAKKYNGDDSWVVKDAQALQKELERVMKKNGFDDNPPPPPKRKPLRIKLSLKTLKKSGDDDGDEMEEEDNDDDDDDDDDFVAENPSPSPAARASKSRKKRRGRSRRSA